MGLREDIQRKIERKQAELLEQERNFDLQRAGALAYIQALQDTLKVIPREPTVTAERTFREGSAIGKTREMIVAAKRPLHINEILNGLGKPNERGARASVVGALGAYVRRGEVFVRTAPNTFGLIELGHHTSSAPEEDEPPADFGALKAS